MPKSLTYYSYFDLRKKLTLLYVLNASDIVFTFGLLKTGMFQEVNALMIGIVTNPWLSIAIKLIVPAVLIIYTLITVGILKFLPVNTIVPAVLIIYILLKLDELPHSNLMLCNYFVNTVLIIYIVINIMHLCYLGLFLYTL